MSVEVSDEQRLQLMQNLFEANPLSLRGLNSEAGVLSYAQYIVDHAAFPEGAQVLDVGCGDAVIMQKLAKLRPDLRLYGVDLSERLIELARINVPQATFISCDVSKGIPFEEKFDRIISFGLAQFFRQAEFIVLCRELLAMLKKDGSIHHLSIPDSSKKALETLNACVEKRGALVGLCVGSIKAILALGSNQYGMDAFWHNPEVLARKLNPICNVRTVRPSDSWYRFDIHLNL